MVHSFLKNNWLFFAAVGVVLAGASLWSRFTGELTSDGVASLVKDRIENPDLSVLSVRPENRDDRVASVRLFGKASTLWFHRSTGEWIWTEIEADEGKSRQSAGKYMDSLRSENEEAAANTLRLINTAQVAAHIRNGRFQTISDLRSSAFLLIDLTAHPLRGYRIETETDGSRYQVYAVPVAYPRTGMRSFYSDETLLLRASDRHGERALPSDPPLAF